MAKYRKKPVEVEAVQWFKEGDYPGIQLMDWSKVKACRHCGQPGEVHGYIDQAGCLSGNCFVCPGDWIVVCGEDGIEALTDNEFRAQYEPAP